MAKRGNAQNKLPSYTAYRNRNRERGRRKWIAALSVLLFLAAAFFVLREFIEFTPDGVRFTFSDRDAPPAETAEIRFAEPVLRVEPRISIDRGELPPDGPGYIEGAVLEVAGRTAGEIAEEAREMKARGCTAAIVPVKAADRPLITEEELEAARAACEGARLRFVAYISCFRDDVSPREDEALGLLSGGRLFIDFTYKTWLNPYLEEARALVLERCRFAVSGGAKELLLDSLFFPYEGNVQTIDYGKQDMTPRELITAFAEEIAENFPGVRLGAVMDGDDTFGEGASEQKGQDVTVFAACFERIWIHAADREDALAVYRKAGTLSEDAGRGFAVIMDGRYVSAALLQREGGRHA